MSDLYRITDIPDDPGVIKLWYAGGGQPVSVVPVEPCEHGNYARHIIEGTVYPCDVGDDQIEAVYEWCDGQPKEGE